MDIVLIREKIRTQKYDLSVHAHKERQNELITVSEIEKALLEEGDIIEQYPQDPRGQSCLVAGKVNNQALHVVCGMRGSRLLIVTVYKPKTPIWRNYKTRRKELKSRV